jgi:hypothetical protein
LSVTGSIDLWASAISISAGSWIWLFRKEVNGTKFTGNYEEKSLIN